LANVSGLGTGTITVIVPANDTGVANFTLNTLAPAGYAGPAPTFTVTAKAEETSLSGGGTGAGNADDPANNIATETKSDEVTFPANIVPVTYDDKVSGSEPASRNVNVMLIIDRSLSMNDEVSAGVTRFELLQEATINMLNAMKANGDVRVMIVTFHTTASAANAWVSVDDAIAAIAAMPPASGSGDNGYTNYEAALAAAINAFADTDGRGSFADHDNDIYFLSDGKPTSGGTTSGNSTDKDHSLTDDQLQNWDKFLETGGNSIDHLHAIGIGADIVAGDSDLKDVADPDYPGDSDSKNPFGQVTIVTNETALEDVLEGTAVTPITGNILNGSIEQDPDAPFPNTPDFQGDGPAHVSYFKYDGAGATNDVTVTWDGAGALSVSGGKSVSIDGSDTNKISFETDHGRMTIDFSTGTFDFAPDSVTADKNEVFDYKITDSNGDLSNQSSLTVTIEDNYTNLAVPLTSHTFANGGWPGSVSGFSNSGNTKSGSGNNNDGWDGEGGDDSLSGGNGNDYLVGGSGDDTLNGGNHNDRLEGGSDDDTLNGNDGNDLLIGGSGLDKFDGGAGSDWLDVDSSDFGAGRSIHGGAGVDVLDLSGIGTFTLIGKTSNVDGIEVVSLEGGGADTVSLKASDVTDLADGNELFVWGDGGDRVNLTNGGWSAGETNVIGSDGSTYNAFNNGAVKVYVETEVTVAMS
jgi:von Willebrand factor type A domain/RTX calcium-binding nonapeptide repeat (4 copies)